MPPLLLLPSLAYYLPDILHGGRLSGQADLSFRPELLQTQYFWLNWRKLLVHVAQGYLPLAAAALGVCFARRGRARRTLIVLLTGDSYGGPLMFYGELAGWYWPTIATFATPPTAASRGSTPSNAWLICAPRAQNFSSARRPTNSPSSPRCSNYCAMTTPCTRARTTI